MNRTALYLALLITSATESSASGSFARPLIEKIEVTDSTIKVQVNKEFKSSYLLDDFFVTYESDINLKNLDESILVMPFIMNVISIVWISGKSYSINSMDSKLFKSLKRIKEIFKRMYPKTSWKGELITRKLVKNRTFAQHKVSDDLIAVLFSGGLDSTLTSLIEVNKRQLLITACGQSDIPLGDKESWEKFKMRSTHFSSHYGHSNSFLISNYSSFLNRKILDKLSPEIISWRIDTVEGLGWAGLTAPILISKGYSHLYLSSSDTWNHPYCGASNPFVDNNLQVAGIRLKHCQFDLSRMDKLEKLHSLCSQNPQLSIPELKVCTENANVNCCACEKCMLTILPLLAIGANHQQYGFSVEKSTFINFFRNYITNLKEVESNYQYWKRYDFLWSCMHIQETVSRRHSEGKIDAELEWFIDFDLTKVINLDFPFAREIIHWDNFREFFPSGVWESVSEIKTGTQPTLLKSRKNRIRN